MHRGNGYIRLLTMRTPSTTIMTAIILSRNIITVNFLRYLSRYSSITRPMHFHLFLLSITPLTQSMLVVYTRVGSNATVHHAARLQFSLIGPLFTAEKIGSKLCYGHRPVMSILLFKLNKMKKIFLSLLLMPALSGQAQDTLKNFNPLAQTPTTLQYGGTANGYYTGHNSYFDEEWAEKYYISGSNQVVGVISYHTGTAGTFTENCEYKVYNVASTGLPGTSLATKPVAGSTINIGGVPVYTGFSANVNVSDSFFVSFNLGDYAHDDPGTKTIALMHGPAGSRAAADTAKFGRNAIRWHDHDDIIWKDFYYENSTPVRTHFAIFPVVAFTGTSVHEYVSVGSLKMGALFPNPATNAATFEVTSEQPEVLNCKLIDITGKQLQNWQEKIGVGAHQVHVGLSDLTAGNYVLIVETAQAGLSQIINKQ